MFKLGPIIISVAVASVAGCLQPAADDPSERAKPGEITDGQVLAYARKARDAGFLQKMEGRRQVLGLHQGTRVVVDFPCSDICPDNTVAVIHYDVEPDENCERAGGVVQLEAVPVSIAEVEQPFCVPKVLARPGSSIH